MKPLYVRGADTWVDFDAPALRVRVPEKSDAWLPLRRISRVISATQVRWSTEALLACAEHGISISFLAEDGRVVACVSGKSGERDELRQRLTDLVYRPGWRDDYILWLNGMEHMAARSLARRAGLQASDRLLPRELQQALREQARDQCLLADYEDLGRRLHGLLSGFVTHHLAQAGVRQEFAGWSDLDLGSDFCRILFWDFRLARLVWLNARRNGHLPLCPSELELTDFFERRSARTSQLCQGLVNRLHHWLTGEYRWR